MALCPTCNHELVKLPLAPGKSCCVNVRCQECHNRSAFCARCGGRLGGGYPPCSCSPVANWDARFIGLAVHLATWSKDPSTKVGCVLVEPNSRTVLGTGFNGFPRGIAELAPERQARPAKYLWTEHAERNAIFNAARHGHAINGAHAFLNWDPRESICADCARALIQSGISKIVGPANTVQGREDIPDDAGWRASCRVGVEMLSEAGVVVLGL